MSSLIPLFVAIPLGMAFFIPMVSRRAPWAPDALGNLTMLCLTVLSFLTIGTTGIYSMGGWPARLGIDLRLDGLTTLLLIAVNGIGLAATIFSIEYMKMYTSKFRYYSLFLFMVAGMNGCVLTADLFNLFVFMEITSIASYALVAFGCEHEELEASFKYMVLGSVASTFVLLGVAFLYAVTGTLNMAQAATRLAAAGPNLPVLFALSLFICGFGLKAALVPFHAWLPDAHPSAPAPISAMLSGVVIKAVGVYVIARLLFNVFGINENLLLILRWLGAVSMVVGVLLAVGQWDMKRLFAYHSISQIGYVVLGLGVGTPLGIVGGLFHLVNHSVFKSLLFLNAGSVEYATGTRDLKRLGGLSRQMPVTGVTSMIASMSIAGIPPFNGFWSKLIIIVACVQAGFYGMAAWAVFVSLMTLASFLKVQKYAFFEAAKGALGEIRRIPAAMAVAMLVLAFCCLAMSFLVVTGLDEPLLIAPAARALMGGVLF
ncbi:MAG: monovalent cation/H+ antiporter subunit D family protein [Kiritimatiellae bacterium]|nr:monovalent cation/H+ antiporter subunit D family protein [Kiritimatiellia bacterium]